MDPRVHTPQHEDRPADEQSRRRRLGQQERDRAEQPAKAERERAAAARERSPRAKVDLYVNEYSGTVTWRTRMTPAEQRHRAAAGPGTRQRPSDERRRAEAAALRSVGIDPKRSRGSGAAPIPTHPATVAAATQAPVTDMTPGQLSSHTARVSALRSQLQGDTARAGRMPTSSAARLRSGLDAARVHSLRVERASSARELARRHQRPRPPRAEQRQRGPAQR